ncbi:MAG: coenzyme F420-0:L-glutamate ligase [Candidatus Bathyarchaeota archaeon]|jgi:F420-0:gamma-glutamyl ligase-like protein|nr:gamma-glutamyl ligase [Candidatus Bathyarchaeota archaeon A05DMB-5]MDH7557099.1 coenzyme F420-0:L-glutamate ligase [Candidatus Bathyarchaeota archaeon]
MVKYKVRVVITKYWRPGEDYLREIIHNVKGKIADGDFVVVSEKAISTALNNIVDESVVEPSLSAKRIAKFWMRIVWGYLLGRLCRLRGKLIQHLKNYPLESGSRHKQVALQYAGLLQALMFGSEGGIDGSNLPYSYVSLPLNNVQEIAQKIRSQIWLNLHKKVVVIIVDTDKTYSFMNFHFTPRPKPFKGIHSFGGFLTYIVGRFLKLKRRATPIAVAGCKLPTENALEIAQIANRVRGFGAGKTVWDMAEKFKAGLTDVSWEMLETVKHKPIVIVRSKR